MLMGSLVTMAIGSYLYIGCEMGCGPRDGLMVALVKKTGKPVGFIRACIQLVFKILKFDVGKIKHKNIRECFVFFNKCING